MKKRYSRFILPLKVIFDLVIINLAIYKLCDKGDLNVSFLTYISFFWAITSYFIDFYRVRRYTNVLRIFRLLMKQFFLFTLGYFAYFGIFRQGEVFNNQFLTLLVILISVSILKLLWFVFLKRYRKLGNNLRTTVVIGYDDSSKYMIRLFKKKSSLGYKYLGFFSKKDHKNKEFLGDLANFFKFINNNSVDEIYCSLTTLSKDEIKKINKFAIDKGIVLKLIPNSSELYSKNQNVEYYDDTIMVLNVSKLPFEIEENLYIKRCFDIFLSIFACVFVLSWLMPILWVLVKLESKGPLIFKQKREGINGQKFVCYKFRSMRINNLSDKKQATKDDVRITKIGAFLRKTSLDELPQFFNVLFGDMSVVGPRPHLGSFSIEYQKDIDDYLRRHVVKPGITGLAQISGYRGEIKMKSDIKNRVRLDIFYIENWSFMLDVKIIFQTAVKVLKGDENAY